MSDDTTMVRLSEERDRRAFERAATQVLRDDAAGLLNCRTYGGAIPHGEIVRVLAEAYIGELRLRVDGEGRGE